MMLSERGGFNVSAAPVAVSLAMGAGPAGAALSLCANAAGPAASAARARISEMILVNIACPWLENAYRFQKHVFSTEGHGLRLLPIINSENTVRKITTIGSAKLKGAAE